MASCNRLNRLVPVAAALALTLAVSSTPGQAQWWNLFDRDRQNAAPPPAGPGAPQPAAPTQPPPPPGAVQGGAPAETAPQPAFRDDPAVQVEQLQAQVRALTGQVEELTHQLDQLRAAVQTRQEDVEHRFEALEGGVPVAESASGVESELPMDGGGLEEPMDAGGGHSDLGEVGPGAPPEMLGSLTLTDPAGAAPAADPDAPLDLSRLARPDDGSDAGGTAPGEVASLPAADTPDAAYDRAYTHLVDGDYGLAEAGFRQVIADYPDSDIVADAQYWLGETFFARGDHRNAADIFLAAYRAYPNGRRAPDTLLKLGLSLDALGERQAACATYAELLAEHQGASNALIQRVQAEQARAEC